MKQKRILIVHAKDAEGEAKRIQDFLKSRGIDSVTYKELFAKATLEATLVSVHEKFVEESAVLIFVVSPGLFTQQYLELTAQMAIYAKKFLPVWLNHDRTKLPLWFSMFTTIDFNKKSLSDPWKKLVTDLQHYTK